MATPLMELTVKLDEPVFVKCADQPGCESNTSPFFLTNIDQMLAFTVETLYFYAANPNKESDGVAATLKAAVGKLLVQYDFVAGRVRLNEEMRMEIDRNDAGAQFSSASCELTMAELGDVTVPNPLFRKFVPQAYNATTIADTPLMMIQVTTLKCGGHVIGFGMSHLLWDGHGVVEFLFNLMSLAQGGPLVVQPKPDRAMFKARQPPTPTFDHPEFLKLDELPPPTSFTTSNAATSEFVELAAFEALSGHVWQARTKAIDAAPSQVAQLLYAVDIRDRLEPALPKGFVGNAIYSACARATCKEVCEGSLAFCVKEIQKANERITNDLIRSGIDWWEVYRGVPAVPSGIYITSWQKMPFYAIDFGWGKPVFAGPAVTPMVEFVVILPTSLQDGGLNVILCLEHHVMRKFEDYVQLSA